MSLRWLLATAVETVSRCYKEDFKRTFWAEDIHFGVIDIYMVKDEVSKGMTVYREEKKLGTE